MLAFVSDIHANLEALTAVLADIDRQGVSGVYCLGDVIGYGPQPRECLELVKQHCEVCLIGNHEHGAMYYASDFNPKARAAIEWTKAQLNLADAGNDENFRLWNYIDSMPQSHTIEPEQAAGGIFLAHGTPRDPIREYLLPADAGDSVKLAGCFEKMGGARVGFVGHSHVPGLYDQSGHFYPPKEMKDGFHLEESRAIVNIGSVGQPRDGDTRSCYVTYDPETGSGSFHRVEYDQEKTMEKIRNTELPGYLADRLAVGR